MKSSSGKYLPTKLVLLFLLFLSSHSAISQTAIFPEGAAKGKVLLNVPTSVFVDGNYAYVVSVSSSSLEIVDISNPANPVHTGNIVDGQGGALLHVPRAVFVSGGLAYVVSNRDAGTVRKE